MQTKLSTRTLPDLIRAVNGHGLVWRLASPGALGTDTRAEALVRHPEQRTPWYLGYGLTVEEALIDVLQKWEARA
jgi:hypothetical protein